MGASAASYTTVIRWAKRFLQEREDVNNHCPSASLLSQFTGKNIELIPEDTSNDPHSTYDEIIAENSLFHGTIE